MDYPQFSVVEATIHEIAEALDSGRITSTDLVMMYMERIAAYDKSGPTINSVIELNPDALHIAEALDAERARLGPRGPLHGVPILIKDNINTGDRMHTSAGSLALKDSYAPEDAFLVKQLRKAGAIILGKTNLTEFANFMADNMPAGYSSRGGQVLNPYRPGKSHPGGSSSGSGSAVACSFCAAAVGTETSGSILSPSCQNSIVGIKPTVGLISRSGIVPIAHSQDTAGPMARTVTDAAALLGAMIGIDESDPVTQTAADKGSHDYTTFLDRKGLEGARIGVPRGPFWDECSEDMKIRMEEALEILRAQGAVLVDPANIATAGQMDSIHVLIYEFKSDLNRYLASLGPAAPVRTLADIIEFNASHPGKTLRYGQAMLVRSEKTSGTLTEPEYINEKLRDLRLSRDQGIDATMAEHNLDALVFPGTSGCDIAARAGYPSITVPAGYLADGEPVGLTFTAKAFSEPVLIKLAYSFEQAAGKRRAPAL